MASKKSRVEELQEFRAGLNCHACKVSSSEPAHCSGSFHNCGDGSNTHDSELSEESDVEDYEHADADIRYLISRCLFYH
jgi:hypothetical protein